jgi:PleD family two-component response regulator
VTGSKTLKLLLVEDSLEDEQLLCEALIEIEENRQWCNWDVSSIVNVDRLSDALDCLRQEWFDAILLNLSLPDSPILLDTFLEANACARGAPIVVLADQDDPHLANLLLREGAQDVLVKSELECVPLARSLRYAIERQRSSKALRASPFLDDLTGTLTRTGFLTIAEHYAQLAQRSRTPLFLASLYIGELPTSTPDNRESHELLLIRAGETLRAAFESPALIGRLDRSCFGVITAGLAATTVEALLHRAATKIEDTASCGGRRLITVRFSVAELDPRDNLEQLLAKGDNDASPPLHHRLKTVMLTD